MLYTFAILNFLCKLRWLDPMILTFIYLEFSGFHVSGLILRIYQRITLTCCWVFVNKIRKHTIEFLLACNLKAVIIYKVYYKVCM